jgi:hypothetical protein
MADPGAGEKLKVFISYSRKDSTAFVDEVVLALRNSRFEVESLPGRGVEADRGRNLHTDRVPRSHRKLAAGGARVD